MIVAKHRLVEIVGQVSSANELLNDEQCRQYDNAVRMILETASYFIIGYKKIESIRLTQ